MSTAVNKRLAIINYDLCQPTRCNKECMKYCPPMHQDIRCITYW